jgi:aspartyl aminopeptidase
MHSSYETAGAKDTEYMIRALTRFYESAIEETESGVNLK